MEETLKMMKSITTGKESKVDEQKLIEQYKKELLPNILAYFYVNNYGMIKNISKLFPLLLSEDIASFCLQELDNCLINYSNSYNVKFTTYFAKCFKNRLRTEVETLMTNKKRIIYNQVNLQDYEEQLAMEIEITDIDTIFNNYNLTLEEKSQCKLSIAGYSIKEIANILKKAPITIYKRNSKIKEKILRYGINFI